jgi:hypothetical protein
VIFDQTTISLIEQLNISGHGGSEKKMKPILERFGFQHVNQKLWDFANPDTFSRIELKKQTSTQWFDIGKYHFLTAAEKNIIMMFVMHEKGVITSINNISLGRFLDLACSAPEFQKNGWTYKNIQDCHGMSLEFPSMQVKVQMPMKKFIKKFQQEFETIYEKTP